MSGSPRSGIGTGSGARHRADGDDPSALLPPCAAKWAAAREELFSPYLGAPTSVLSLQSPVGWRAVIQPLLSSYLKETFTLLR